MMSESNLWTLIAQQDKTFMNRKGRSVLGAITKHDLFHKMEKIYSESCPRLFLGEDHPLTHNTKVNCSFYTLFLDKLHKHHIPFCLFVLPD